MNPPSYSFRKWIFTTIFLSCASTLLAQENGTIRDVEMLDKILAAVPAGKKLAQVGDMEILVSNLRLWRNRLANPAAQYDAFDGNAPIWTGGNLYYTFDASVSAANQKAFLDGANEWATFANLHFIPRTVEPDYFTVIENPSLSGGQSAVGMIGGQQFLQIGPSSWNRGTICHELGHTLGLIHEHQRSDRDSFITILTNNIIPGAESNYIKLGNSLNQGTYDFLSVMHYTRNALSVDSNLDTIEPLPAYSQFLDVLGKGDPVLTPLDRAGMATIYGAAPANSPDVTNTQDSGIGSFRAAIYYGFDHPGTTITFHIPTSDPGFSNNVFNILPTDQLPSLWNATLIDGGTEPTNSNPSGPEILLNGALTHTPSVFSHGLHLRGTNCGVRTLIINDFAGYGILIDGTNATENGVGGCYLGVDPTGAFAVTNGLSPLAIANGASSNFIGGPFVSARNIISGSSSHGIVLRDAGTKNNFVRGNFIGLNAAGNAPLPNAWSGVAIFNGAQSNVIGGTVAGMGNMISGNNHQGVTLGDAGTQGNQVEGNYIGLDSSGATAIPNGWAGIDISGGAQSNMVGGATSGARNVISGNNNQGIIISGAATIGNSVQGNYIGVNANGTQSISNAWDGIGIFDGAQNTMIGGISAGTGNVISGNSSDGIAISGESTSNIVIQGNFIGSDINGTTAISNKWDGIGIFNGAKFILIGGAALGAGNVISGNGASGVTITGTNADCSAMQGNFIGVDVSGTNALSNAFDGVGIGFGAKSNLVGGTLPAMKNIISGNGSAGVLLIDTNTTDNRIEGNFIGLNVLGTGAIPNITGVTIRGGAQSNLLGGGIGTRNFISGNSTDGILIIHTNTSFNLIQGNTIGLDGANNAAVPNGSVGVIIFSAQSNQIGGLSLGAGNIIAGNSNGGVVSYLATSVNNSIRANSIFGNGDAAGIISYEANHSIEAPDLSSATLAINLTVSGSVTLEANSSVELDFYTSPFSPVSTQGKTFIGTRSISSTSGGATNFSFALNAIVSSGQIITATVTDSTGNTSPFSAGATDWAISGANDGITDAWRALYFGGSGTTTNNQSCATCDPDGDGANNSEEFFAGTNPTNAASRFTIISVQSTNGVAVVIPSVNGINYRLESRDGLETNPWSILADQILGNGTNISVADPASMAVSKRFYRGKILP